MFTVDCAYGPWAFGDCSVTCGDGIQLGTRPIVIEAAGEGDPCDEETVTARACADPTPSPCPTPAPGKQESYFLQSV